MFDYCVVIGIVKDLSEILCTLSFAACPWAIGIWAAFTIRHERKPEP